MILIIISCVWIAGLFLGSRLNPPLALVGCGLLPLPLIFLVKKYRKHLIIFSICLATLFGAAFYSASNDSSSGAISSFGNQENLELIGIIKTPPEIRDKVTRLELMVDEIKTDAGWQNIHELILVFVPRYPEYRYGDILWLKGKPVDPPQLDDFDYLTYLSQRGIHSIMLYPQIKVLQSGTGTPSLNWIYSLRDSLSRSLSSALPEPQASLGKSIVLGIRSTIPDDLRTDLSITGTAHLLAISGVHLSIIAGMLVALGIRLWGRRHYLYVWLALFMIWFYALITGMQAPVIRAAIMASLFLMAELLGRQKSAFVALAFSAAVMAGIDPQILWSISFQLSFLAMTGLVFIAPVLQGWGRNIISRKLGEEGAGFRVSCAILDSFSVTLAALIAVWPLIAHYFHIVSFIAPLSTLLIAPALPAIIFTGFITAIIGLISLPAAHIAGWISWLFLSYMLWLVKLFAGLPLVSISTSLVQSGLIQLYYGILAMAIALKPYYGSIMEKIRNRVPITGTGGTGKANFMPIGLLFISLACLKSILSKTADLYSGMSKKWVITPLLVLAFLTTYAAATLPDSHLHVSILDVGEGDSILIQTNGQNILIDGGPSPQAVCQGLSSKMPFWDRSLDLVILTHPHLDHLNGLVEVLKRYQVKQVLAPNLHSGSPVYTEWLDLINKQNIRYTLASAGQRLELAGRAVIEVLNPPDDIYCEDGSETDNKGVVLILTLDNISFLFMADTGRDVESRLISQRAGLESTVLKVAHHGSSTSTTSDFLSVVNPRSAVISVGENNLHRHPHADVLERLRETLGTEDHLYRTDKHGTIEFITDGMQLWIKTER